MNTSFSTGVVTLSTILGVSVGLGSAVASPTDIGLKGPNGRTIRYSLTQSGAVLLEECTPNTDIRTEACNPSLSVEVPQSTFKATVIHHAKFLKALAIAETLYAPNQYSLPDQSADLERLAAVEHKIRSYEEFEPANTELAALRTQQAKLKSKIEGEQSRAQKAKDERDLLASAEESFVSSVMKLIESKSVHYYVVQATPKYESGPIYQVLTSIVAALSTAAPVLDKTERGWTASQDYGKCIIVKSKTLSNQFMVWKNGGSADYRSFSGMYFEKDAASVTGWKAAGTSPSYLAVAHATTLDLAVVWLKTAISAGECR